MCKVVKAPWLGGASQENSSVILEENEESTTGGNIHRCRESGIVR